VATAVLALGILPTGTGTVPSRAATESAASASAARPRVGTWVLKATVRVPKPDQATVSAPVCAAR
jgi:hypothetical protein